MNSMSRLGKNDNLHVRPGLEPTVRQESEIKGNIFTLLGDPNNFSQIAEPHTELLLDNGGQTFAGCACC